MLKLLPAEVVGVDGRLEVTDNIARVRLSVCLRNPNGSVVTGRFVCALPTGLVPDSCAVHADGAKLEGQS